MNGKLTAKICLASASLSVRVVTESTYFDSPGFGRRYALSAQNVSMNQNIALKPTN